jgi:hypothetical protein
LIEFTDNSKNIKPNSWPGIHWIAMDLPLALVLRQTRKASNQTKKKQPKTETGNHKRSKDIKAVSPHMNANTFSFDSRAPNRPSNGTMQSTTIELFNM